MSTLNITIRRDKIFQYLKEKGPTNFSKIANEFNVTGPTLRVDLEYLISIVELIERFDIGTYSFYCVKDDPRMDHLRKSILHE